ncbi:interleukin-22 receptor subunit alpha-2 [Archocentrus centrarchus]|uniref:interleukin-22 receptor subunit alpha-2 n=1 Tax=Archocentrus centrarchus TaxID=63155 RepID=UPI0011EA3221|nr:interleukin-22 receptor subunit alpha-2-like [Archocentrus centrarchus]
MTSLLIGTMLLGNLGICVTAQEMLARPTQVKFDSVDYKNILIWTPPTNSNFLEYYVQWKIYGEPEWMDMHSCQGIQKHHCDLSNVTSNPREWYYARVHALSVPTSSKSAWALSSRFSPRWDTKISPPVLRLNVTEKPAIVIRVKHPRPLVQKLHSSLYYKIYLKHPSGEEEVLEMECCSHKLTLKELSHKAKYCLQAQTILPLQGKSSTRSSVKCITTP